mgnify:CR=1 FL=1
MFATSDEIISDNGISFFPNEATGMSEPIYLACRVLSRPTQGLPETEAAAKKAQIDSIATLLANGGDFEA